LVSSIVQQHHGIKLTTTPWYQVNKNTLVSSKLQQHHGIMLTTTPWYQVNKNTLVTTTPWY